MSSPTLPLRDEWGTGTGTQLRGLSCGGEGVVEAGGEFDCIQALASLHVSASSLSPADRDSMLVAYANYRESLKVLKIVLDLLDRAMGLALSDQTVDAKSIYGM